MNNLQMKGLRRAKDLILAGSYATYTHAFPKALKDKVDKDAQLKHMLEEHLRDAVSVPLADAEYWIAAVIEGGADATGGGMG